MSIRFDSRNSSHSHSQTRSTPLPPPAPAQGARSSSKWFFRTGAPLLLFFAGVGALGYCGYVVIDARSSQGEQSRQFDRALLAAHSTAATSPVLPSFQDAPAFFDSNGLVSAESASPNSSTEHLSLPPGGPVGRIEIASIGLSAMIQEGTGRQTLQRGVGHITGTALVGKSGNVGLAGHRDTFFRKLRNIHQGDEIALTTLDGSFMYRVDLISIVEPQSSEVLRDSGENLLTLVTCYPFSYVGPSPKRFIVRARMVPAAPAAVAAIQ